MIHARRRQKLTASTATVTAAALPVPAVAAVRKKTPAARTALALTPPMGWNRPIRKCSRKTRRVTRTGRCTPTKAWSACANDTKSVYFLALFNTEDMSIDIAFDLSHLNLGDKTVALGDLWTRRGLPAARGIIRHTIKPHGSVLLSLSA